MAEEEVLMSIADWLTKTDNFLMNNRRKVFQGKVIVTHDSAVKKAEDIYKEFRIRQDREYISLVEPQVNGIIRNHITGGKSVAFICREFNLPKSTVYYWIKKYSEIHNQTYKKSSWTQKVV